MTTAEITTAEVQQIRQNAIFQGEVTRDQARRLAQSWLEQDHRLDELRGQIGIEVRDRDQWETNAERAETVLDRVRAIHQPQPGQGPACCVCDEQWPCPTTRALAGDDR